MRVKHLAEAIILQSIEDLWNENHRENSVKFFSGENFRTCARIAGMDISEQIKILNMLEVLIKDIHKHVKDKKISFRNIPLQSEINGALIRT
jgi:hypothetical protein